MTTPGLEQSSSLRIRSLDGLRGLAALTVLFFHLALMFPTLSDAIDGRHFPQVGSLAWWLTATPLHAFWAGDEAVYLFFILSGIVLTLPALQYESFDWGSYYPRRLLRIYLPVWVAVCLTAITMQMVHRAPELQNASWLARRITGYSPETLRTDLTLLWGDVFGLSPLWSLRWEVVFSLLLPIFVLFAVRARRAWMLKSILLIAFLIIGALGDWPEFRYLPMFAVGALLAAHWDEVGALVSRVISKPYWAIAMLLIALVLFTARRWSIPFRDTPTHFWWAGILAIAGAVLLILLATHWTVARRILEWGPVHWIGLISFSLYLVHEPIIIALRYALIDSSPALVALIGIPLSILIAWFFNKTVEVPAARIARRFGRSVASDRDPLSRRTE